LQTTRRRIPKYSYHKQNRGNFKYYHIGLSRNPLQTREDSFTLKEKELLFVAGEDKRRKICLTLPLNSYSQLSVEYEQRKSYITLET